MSDESFPRSLRSVVREYVDGISDCDGHCGCPGHDDLLVMEFEQALGVGHPEGPMTEAEHEAMDLSGALAGCLRRIIGTEGPQVQGDWAEAAQRIHAIQHTIMAQAASRSYPTLYRPLGGVVDED